MRRPGSQNACSLATHLADRLRCGARFALCAMGTLPAMALAGEVSYATADFIERGGGGAIIISIETLPGMGAEAALGSIQSGDWSSMGEVMGQVQAQVSTMMNPGVFDQYPGVSFSLPLMPYGRSGSFSDVEIKSGEGRSFDPGHYRQYGREKYVGQVTIEEFNRVRIVGSFSAHLYRPGERPREVISEGSVSGWFRIAAPVLGDLREPREWSPGEEARIHASSILDARTMMGGALTGGYDLYEVYQEQDSEAPSSIGTGSGTPGGSGVNDDSLCYCDCHYLAILPPENACWANCRAQGLQCLDHDDDPGVDPLIRELRAMGMSPDQEAEMVELLKDMPPAQRAQMLEMYKAMTGDSG